MTNDISVPRHQSIVNSRFPSMVKGHTSVSRHQSIVDSRFPSMVNRHKSILVLNYEFPPLGGPSLRRSLLWPRGGGGGSFIPV